MPCHIASGDIRFSLSKSVEFYSRTQRDKSPPLVKEFSVQSGNQAHVIFKSWAVRVPPKKKVHSADRKEVEKTFASKVFDNLPFLH